MLENKNAKDLVVKTVIDAIKFGIDGMAYPSKEFLWYLFTTTNFNEIFKIKELLDFLERVAEIVPDDIAEKITKEMMEHLENELKVNTVEEKPKEEKKEKPKDVKVTTSTKVIKVNSADEFLEAMKNIAEEMKESMKDVD